MRRLVSFLDSVAKNKSIVGNEQFMISICVEIDPKKISKTRKAYKLF